MIFVVINRFMLNSINLNDLSMMYSIIILVSAVVRVLWTHMPHNDTQKTLDIRQYAHTSNLEPFLLPMDVLTCESTPISRFDMPFYCIK